MLHEINDNNMKSYQDLKQVVLDFYADWCGPCKKMAPVIQQVSEANPEITFLKINVDNNPDLADKYNVASIPTLIFSSNGNVVDSSIGVVTAKVLQNKLELLKNL